MRPGEGGGQQALVHVVPVVGRMVVGRHSVLVSVLRGVPPLPLSPGLSRLLLDAGLLAAAVPASAGHCRQAAATQLGAVLGLGLGTRFFVRN